MKRDGGRVPRWEVVLVMPSAAPAESFIHTAGGDEWGEADVVRDGGQWGARPAAERYGMVIDALRDPPISV
jgi:hypothetical protein